MARPLGTQPSRHTRFEVAAPRHFLLPAILLLLAEEPRHGYSLAKGVHELQVGRVDRPSVYRALAQLEADGLVESSPDAPRGGQGRRVYYLTEAGEQVLRRWMGVIKQERDGLDRVLRRYVATGTVDAVLAEVEGGWHAVTAAAVVAGVVDVARSSAAVARRCPRQRLPDATTAAPIDEPPVADPVTARRFRLVPDRSVVLVDARSSVGPDHLRRHRRHRLIEAAVAGRRVLLVAVPTAHLEIDVEQLRSGNSLYDAELLRRIDARRHPDRRASTCGRAPPSGSTERYQLAGEVTFHGVTPCHSRARSR